ncbi:MAG: hypothetical protein ACI4SH_07315 [Candidatus Scatosoma sp.]
MKKRFVSLVAAVCLIACLGLVGCNKDPKIKSGGTYKMYSYVPKTVEVGDEEYEYSFGGVVTIGEKGSYLSFAASYGNKQFSSVKIENAYNCFDVVSSNVVWIDDLTGDELPHYASWVVLVRDTEESLIEDVNLDGEYTPSVKGGKVSAAYENIKSFSVSGDKVTVDGTECALVDGKKFSYTVKYYNQFIDLETIYTVNGEFLEANAEGITLVTKMFYPSGSLHRTFVFRMTPNA